MTTDTKLLLMGMTVALLSNFHAEGVVLRDAFGEYSREDIARLALENGAKTPWTGALAGVFFDSEQNRVRTVRPASCVAIADNLVLTAKHATFISGTPGDGQPFDELLVVFGDDVKAEFDAGNTYRAIAVHLHPTLDLAVLVFEDGALADVPQAKISAVSPRPGERVCITGLGKVAFLGQDKFEKRDGYRRAAFTAVSPEVDSRLDRQSHQTGWFYSHGGAPTDGKATDGDSGGSVSALDESGNVLSEICGIVKWRGGGPYASGSTSWVRLDTPAAQQFLSLFIDIYPDEMDNDDDGVDNLTEMAVGSDPFDANSEANIIRTLDTQSGIISVRYLRFVGGEERSDGYVRGNLCYVVEFSENLIKWSRVETTTFSDNSVPPWSQWAQASIEMNQRRGFLRFRVVRLTH